MSKTSAEWSKQICSALNNIDPSISVEVGDPIRKVIDAVASVASAIDMNSQVNHSFFDLDSKSGADLDAIASWLGFGRRDGIKATGEVRFYLDNPATVAIEIPTGAQVSDNNVVFETVNSVVIDQGEYEINARVQCMVVGVVGNVNAYQVNQVLYSSGQSGLRVENPYNMSGGVDIETDAELRKRIRQTFLRNVAGTEDAYRGIADKVVGTNRVNVVGPIERWEEQLEIVDLDGKNGKGTLGFKSMIPCSKFTWPRQTYLVREPGTEHEKAFTEGVEYIVDRSDKSIPRQPTVKTYVSANNIDLDSKSGKELDDVGKALGLPRFEGTQASGTVAFGFDNPMKSNYTLNKGTRVKSPDGDIFDTMAATTIYSQSLSSSTVGVQSEALKPISVSSGTMMTLVDRTGFKCEVSIAIHGGEVPWTDEVYRRKLADEFNRQMCISVGDHLFFKHEYTPIDSRNEPEQNPPLVNKVDVFFDGIDAQPIREVSKTHAVTLNEVPDDMWNINNFYYEDGSQPKPGTKIEVLGYSPVMTLPDSLNINGAKYSLGTHYTLIKNQTLTRGSTREIDAIAWIPGASMPSDDSFTDYTYTYNRSVIVTDQLLDTNRQITTDVLAHEAKRVGLTINLIIQVTLGVSDEQILSQLNTLFDAWTNSLEFGSWIQKSDIEYVARQCAGVDACRVAKPTDTNRKITIGDNVGKNVPSGVQTTEKYRSFLPKQHDEDFRLWESMLPYIYQLNIVREAANTYE